MLTRLIRIEIGLLIILGCVPVLKRPGEVLAQFAYRSAIVTPIRRLLSRISTVGYSESSTNARGGQTRHEKAARALQNSEGVNLSHAKALNGSNSEHHIPMVPVNPTKDSEEGNPGIQVTNSFQVV